MIMPPALRKLALIIHITASVGWTGAVASFLALAVAGLASDNPEVVRGVYIAMDVTVRYMICLLYTSPSPRDRTRSRKPSSA